MNHNDFQTTAHASPFRAGVGSRVRWAVIFSSCLVFLGGFTAIADEEWSGAGGDNRLDNDANWVSGNAPDTGYNGNENLFFGNVPTSSQTVDLGRSVYFGQLTIDSTVSYSLGGGSVVTPQSSTVWTISGSGNHVLDIPINLRSNLTILNFGTGTLTINSEIGSWGSGSVLTLGGTGTTLFGGSVGGGVQFAITGGNNTITASMPGGGTIEVSGGSNNFDTSFGGGTTLNLTGGENTISGGIGGGSEIFVNTTGGSLAIDGDIGGGAQIDVDEGNLTLNGNIDGGADLMVEEGGTLLLTDGVSVGGGGVLSLDGGTLAVEGTVAIPNVTLSGDSMIDLGNDPNAQTNIGNISGDGHVDIINYVNTNQVTFDPESSSIEVEEQVTFEGAPATTTGPGGDEIVPEVPPVVPEPGISLGLGALTCFALFHGYRKWHRERSPAIDE